MIIILDFWSRQWQSVSFDTLSGRGHIRWFSRKPSNCNGWAFVHNGLWYAIWDEDHRIFFQAGTKCWIKDENIFMDNQSNGKFRSFTVSEGETLILKVIYRDITPEYDPTYDEFDLEQEDFFVFVTRKWGGFAEIPHPG